MGRKIMIIDNDSGFLKWLQGLLALAGYDVYSSDNENLSFEKISQINPDVCLFGFDKDQRNGFLLTQKFRMREENEIPVIAMMSSCCKSESKKIIETYRLDGYLSRPFMPLDVIFTIETFLDPEIIMSSNEVSFGLTKCQ